MSPSGKRILDSIAETFKLAPQSQRTPHKLYREETYISEPLNNTREFVQSPPDVHNEPSLVSLLAGDAAVLVESETGVSLLNFLISQHGVRTIRTCIREYTLHRK
ncbi:hypothetical protein DPMN_129170 [Dreissena polymorpha]|uniref:Uncharacterized protein n=1 Tax=Dreissena polymorpha TaxID=45954 RepID=A0A9D4JWD9_DREPO|nr:hypothetical protein DPMN_129170 [Dreissena polymorpha]